LQRHRYRARARTEVDGRSPVPQAADPTARQFGALPPGDVDARVDPDRQAVEVGSARDPGQWFAE
jgi:hypothetical protein